MKCETSTKMQLRKEKNKDTKSIHNGGAKKLKSYFQHHHIQKGYYIDGGIGKIFTYAATMHSYIWLYTIAES